MIPESPACSFAQNVRQQECREQKSTGQVSREQTPSEPVTKEQTNFNQWNNYRNLVLFWRFQEARQSQASLSMPQLTPRATRSVLSTSGYGESSSGKLSDPETWKPVGTCCRSPSCVSDLTHFFHTLDSLAPDVIAAPPEVKGSHGVKVNRSFLSTSGSAASSVQLSDPEPWRPAADGRRCRSPACFSDSTQFFDALDLVAPNVIAAISEVEEPHRVKAVIRRQSWGLRLRPVCLLMALTCVLCVIVSAINLYLTPPLPWVLPDPLPLPLNVTYHEEEKPASEEPSCFNWECLSHLWD